MKPLNYNDLAKFIETLTPEQREMPVIWNGEGCGGHIYETAVLDDDQVNPSGEGWEDRNSFIQSAIADGETYEEVADEPIVAHKGQPYLCVDDDGV